ncbi:helix-turn-helix transcriptional regulator [Pseudonocardia sp.]|uniref:helix-turn-helix transcriptional regulator n=1 Tax=Pseudonocardia sp. TaxID=60912 RepID=UPI003D0ABF16
MADGGLAGRRLLCPGLVGRTAEAALLHARVAGLAQGRGGVVLLVGAAGTGKTRLTQEVADAAVLCGAPMLAGRAVPGSTVAYRPLTEAFLGAFRNAPPPDAPELAGLGAHLGRLVPSWQGAGADDSPLLLGETVLRLLRRHGAGRGCVLVLEDLHWADAETLAALDHLADAAPDEPVLCVCTARPDGAAVDTVERLERRDPGSVVRIALLPDEDVDRMVAACLATSSAPPEIAAFVRAHGDGTPFLVEELLAGLVAAGHLRWLDGSWACEGELTLTVPVSLRESVGRRMVGLTPTARRVVGAAALLGRRFDWELLPGIAEVDGRSAADALRAAVDEQLVDVDGAGFAFRHSLTREAVLADLLPPDRRDLARRAWPAIERANPGLPGGLCELAAELAEAAGASGAAAQRLVESSRRALAAGAFISAEAAARRAVRVAPPGDAVALDAGESLLRVLVAAGKPGEAGEAGRRLAASVPPARRADLLAVTARAALAGGDRGAAGADVAAARAALTADPDPAVGARLDAVAAYVALECGRLDEAAALADTALAAAEGQAEVECEALEVRGRVARTRDLAEGQVWFRRAADVASRHGLASWHLRAQHELALLAWPSGDVEPLRETRALAARYGALVTVAVMDLSLADIALGAFDRDGALAAATACVEASRRFGLATEPVAHLWLAGAHALAGDDVAMEAAISRSLARDPEDPRILGDLYGRVLLTSAVVSGDLEAVPALLETGMEHVRRADPATSVFPGRVLWTLVRAADGADLGAAARIEYAAAADRIGMPMFHLQRELIEAVALGREGHPAAAERMERARSGLRRMSLSRGLVHVVEMLAARAAIRDGWGDPAAWLREAEAFFAAGGYGRTARRCRLLLAQAGAPVPRRGRGDSVVPATLRALGVTSREVDVLRLVVGGLSNRQIGERLYLSPKTVERHLGSLYDRTGVRNRAALRELARDHGVQSG